MASSQDAIVEAFLLNNLERQRGEENLQTAFQGFADRPITDRPSGSYGEDFVRGANQGLNSLSTDLDYFKALGNTLLGRDEAAKSNLEDAKLNTRESEFAVKGIPTFEQFLNEPTIDGFFSQAFSGIGQVSPFLVETLASALVGGIAGAGAKAVLSAGEKAVAKRLIVDTVKKKAAGETLDSTEQAMLDGAYSTLRANRFGAGAKTGAQVGAVGGTYPINTGESFKEFDEAGVQLNADRAIQSMLLGGVSTAVELGGEAAVFGNLAKLAKRKADPTNPNSLLNIFAKNVAGNFAKTATIEAATETTQEALLIGQRMAVDDNYSLDEAYLRLGQAAFLGAIAGGVPGGIGGAISTAPEAVSRIFDKANDLTSKARDGQVSAEVDNEIYGDINSIYTTPEPEADIQAQFDAMFDPDSAKKAVWLAGREGKAGPVEINGKKAYAASVKGRGAIFSTDPDIVKNVVRRRASDEALAEALGYSAPKSVQNPGDIVVQAIDKNGRVISEEVTDQAGLEMATAAAAEIAGKKGSTRVTSVEEALAARKARKGPVISGMEEDQQMDQVDANEQSFADPGEMTTVEEQAVELKGLLDKNNQNRYKRRNKTSDVYEGTAEARQRFQEVVSPRKYIDWTRSRYGFLSDAILKEAVSLQEKNPDVIIDVDFNPDGTHSITAVAAPNQQLYTIQDRGGRQRKVTLEAFIGESIAAARTSKFASTNTQLIDTNSGEVFAVNLSDLVNAGKRINEAEITGEFSGRQGSADAQSGLSAILSALAERGYTLEVDGAPIQGNNRRSIPDSYKNIIADAGSGTTLFDALGASPSQTTVGLDEGNRSISDQTNRETSTSNPEEFYLQSLINSGTPLSALNIQDGPIAGDAKDPVFPTNSFNAALQTIFTGFVRRLRLKKPVSFYMLSDLINQGYQSEVAFGGGITYQDPIDSLFSDEKVKDLMREIVFGTDGKQGLIDSETSWGRHIAFNDAHVIIINDRIRTNKKSSDPGDARQEQTMITLTMAHELGHALLEEHKTRLLTDPSLARIRENLYRDFEKARSNPAAPGQYQDPETGFDEYLADQFAIYVKQRVSRGKDAAVNPDSPIANKYRRFFEQIYKSLLDGWKYLTTQNKFRFSTTSKSASFEAFVDDVVRANKYNKRQDMQAGLAASFEVQVVIRELEDAVRRSFPKQVLAKLEANTPLAMKALLKGGAKIFLPAITNLRRLGRENGIGAKIAAMMEGRSYEKGLGFLQNKTMSMNRWRNKLLPILEGITEDDLNQAQSSTPTAELTGKAREVREFLNTFYDEYIAKNPLSKIGRRPDFFPVSLYIDGIRANPEQFIQTILSEDPTADEQKVRKTVDSILKYDAENRGVVTEGQTVEGTENEEEAFDNMSKDFLSSVKEAIDLTKNVRREKLAEGGFLNAPDMTLVHYVDRVTKKVEWDKATKSGPQTLRDLLAQLSPEERAEAQKIINTFLGVGIPKLDPTLQGINSTLQLIQMLTTLSFAAVSSIPELASAIIYTREMSELHNSFKTILDTFKNRTEALAFANEIGVVTSEAMTNAFMSELDTHFLSGGARKIAAGYFKYTGLTYFTQFTRIFAAKLGRNFIVRHAMQPMESSARFLDELGVTADEVKSWVEGGESFNTPEGEKVRLALAKFVESTMLRPNAAQRPLWASDPRYALLWQLKSFPYSYGQVVIGGIMRELKTRQRLGGTEQQKVAEMTAFLAMAGLTVLPFAALSMELKEWLKYSLQGALPGISRDRSVFRSDRMDALEYIGALYSSAGALGPLSLVTSFWEDASNLKFPNYAFGPTVDTAYQLLANQNYGRLLPLYNQL